MSLRSLRQRASALAPSSSSSSWSSQQAASKSSASAPSTSGSSHQRAVEHEHQQPARRTCSAARTTAAPSLHHAPSSTQHHHPRRRPQSTRAWSSLATASTSAFDDSYADYQNVQPPSDEQQHQHRRVGSILDDVVHTLVPAFGFFSRALPPLTDSFTAAATATTRRSRTPKTSWSLPRSLLARLADSLPRSTDGDPRTSAARLAAAIATTTAAATSSLGSSAPYSTPSGPSSFAAALPLLCSGTGARRRVSSLSTASAAAAAASTSSRRAATAAAPEQVHEDEQDALAEQAQHPLPEHFASLDALLPQQRVLSRSAVPRTKHRRERASQARQALGAASGVRMAAWPLALAPAHAHAVLDLLERDWRTIPAESTRTKRRALNVALRLAKALSPDLAAPLGTNEYAQAEVSAVRERLSRFVLDRRVEVEEHGGRALEPQHLAYLLIAGIAASERALATESSAAAIQGALSTLLADDTSAPSSRSLHRLRFDALSALLQGWARMTSSRWASEGARTYVDLLLRAHPAMISALAGGRAVDLARYTPESPRTALARMGGRVLARLRPSPAAFFLDSGASDHSRVLLVAATQLALARCPQDALRIWDGVLESSPRKQLPRDEVVACAIRLALALVHSEPQNTTNASDAAMRVRSQARRLVGGQIFAAAFNVSVVPDSLLPTERQRNLDVAEVERRLLVRKLVAPASEFAVDALLHYLVAEGELARANGVFQVATSHHGMRLGATTYQTLAAANARAGKLQRLEDVLAVMRASGYVPNRELRTTQLDAYVEGGAWLKAIELYREMSSSPDPALKPDAAVFNTVLKALIAVGTPTDKLLQLFKQSIAVFGPHVRTCNLMLQSLCDSGMFKLAEELFLIMDDPAQANVDVTPPDALKPDVYTFTILAEGYLKHGLYRGAKRCLAEMSSRKIEMTFVTYGTLVSAYCRDPRDLSTAFRYSDVRNARRIGEEFITNMPRVLAKHGKPGERGYELMRERAVSDVLSPLIATFGRLRMTELAADMFESIVAQGGKPTLIARVSLMDAYRHARDLSAVRAVWDSIKQWVVDEHADRDERGIAHIFSESRDVLCLPLMVLARACRAAGQHGEFLSEWFKLASMGFRFDAANWNAFAEALALSGDLERALRVTERILMAESDAEADDDVRASPPLFTPARTHLNRGDDQQSFTDAHGTLANFLATPNRPDSQEGDAQDAAQSGEAHVKAWSLEDIDKWLEDAVVAYRGMGWSPHASLIRTLRSVAMQQTAEGPDSLTRQADLVAKFPRITEALARFEATKGGAQRSRRAWRENNARSRATAA